MNVPDTASLRIASPSATCPVLWPTIENVIRFCAKMRFVGAVEINARAAAATARTSRFIETLSNSLGYQLPDLYAIRRSQK